nr:efflux RND transporter periplasmic adaptor subunit [uncultured Campylobacter sp.]
MKKVASLIFAAFLISGCSYFEKKEESGAKQGGETPALPVGVFTAKSADVPIILKFNGQTVSELEIMLKPQVSGTIEKQLFEPGHSIKKGDVLYEIDRSRYQAVFDSANATLQSASADYKRAKALKAGNTISQKDFDTAKAAFMVAEANFKSAKIDLDHSLVTAPFDGMAGDTQKDVGAYVNVGEDLVRLSKFDPIDVEFGIADVDRLELDTNLKNGQWKQLGRQVSINLGGKDYNGTLSFIDSVINTNTASVSAKAQIPNPNLEIRPGIFTKVSVEGFYQKNGFKIPQVALKQDLSNTIVYVVQDGKVAKKVVKIAAQDTRTATISSGLQDGDQIILDNFKKINVGSKVTPVPASADPYVAGQPNEQPSQSNAESGK